MIKIRNIHKDFKNQKVLKGVDLDIPSGCIQSLLGANGAGKSTLVHILSGIMLLDEGEIFIDTNPITIDSYKYRVNVGYVFEQPMYIEKYTADEYLYFVGRMYQIDKNILIKRIDDLLLFFDLPDDKYIEKYSKGMKSKVSIAAALIHKPKYLILDEPFDSIDFLSVQKITKLFRSMAESGCTIFVTSHQYDIIANMCDKFALLKDGKILFNNTLSELTNMSREYCKEDNPVKSYLESLMEDSNKIKKNISWLNS